jgi:glutathione S-transferase
VTDLVLVTIPFSHYCDKARWALDRAGIPYEERAHLPLLHYLPARLAGGGKTVPVLKTPERTLCDSTDILHWVDARLPAPRRLFPDEPEARAEVVRWEERFDASLGPAARRWAYGHLLPDLENTRRLMQQNVPAAEALAVRAAYPVARALLRRGLNINPESCARSLARLHELFDEVGAAVSGGREFLVGDRLSAADVTFAALAAPALFPDRITRWLCPRDQLPAPMRAEVDRFRATPAGAYALRLYSHHR